MICMIYQRLGDKWRKLIITQFRSRNGPVGREPKKKPHKWAVLAQKILRRNLATRLEKENPNILIDFARLFLGFTLPKKSIIKTEHADS